VVGCGAICGAYLGAGQQFRVLDFVACADLLPERAQARAQEFGVPRVCSVDDLVADPNVDVVLNLTVPKAHAGVATAALRAGKHTYAEKPFAVSREEGRPVYELAKKKQLRIGCAPDTFLGAGIQTCRKLIDDGWIGRPIGAAANMICHGHEDWHADPEFYYTTGGGPLFDMGPYYLTALVNLLGPVKRVTGSATITYPQRVVTSQPKYGTVLQVECPTHVMGIMEFANGAIGTIAMSFDVWAAQVPCLEIYGTEGTLAAPDPNCFGGPVRLWRNGAWSEVPLSHGYAEQSRSIGLADMAYGIRTGRPHRASGEMAFHVLDVMCGFYDAWEQGKWVALETTCERPAPLPLGLPAGTLDE